jgi:two-component system CheB/CheR fusion protein
MTHLPADSGMAFVLVQHLDLKHHSMLTEFLSKKTAMRVTEVIDGMKVERDHG